MAINTQPSSLLKYLSDQKYVGGNNDVGNLLGGFFEGYLSGKKEQDVDIAKFNEKSKEGVEGHNLTMQMLGQTGLVPQEMVDQVQLTPVERQRGNLERFASAFLGNKHRAEELMLKQKTAQLEGQELQNREASSSLDDVSILAQKMSQLRQGVDVDATGLQNPKSLQNFEMAKNQYVAQQRIAKDGNDLNGLINGIAGDAWQKPQTYDSLVQFYSQHPFLNKQQSDTLKMAIDRVKKNIAVNEDGGDVEFKEDPITGVRFAIRGKQTLKSGTNPAFAPSKYDTLDYTSLLRRRESVEKEINKGMDSKGRRYDASKLRSLREQMNAIENQIKEKQPGKNPIASPQMTIQATPKDKAALANQIAQEHPDWTREQILQEANK